MNARICADEIKLRIVRWRDLPGVSRGALKYNHKCPYKRSGGRSDMTGDRAKRAVKRLALTVAGCAHQWRNARATGSGKRRVMGSRGLQGQRSPAGTVTSAQGH